MTPDQTATAELPELPTPDRHNLDFEFQIVPQELRDDNATDLDKLRYATLRFATVIDLLDFEVGDLPGKTRQEMKARINNFGLFLNNAKNGVRHGMLPAAKSLFNHWVGNLSALAWNVLDSFFKAKDQRVFMHLVNLYNAGHITLPHCNKPLNECTFAEVIAAEQDQERQYWTEMQRRGEFIALTAENLKPAAEARSNELETLTTDDFVLARQAIEKADLIAYQAPDGRRVVLKDTTGVTGVQEAEPETT